VPENPSTPAQALAIAALVAKAATPTRADARHQHAIADGNGAHAGSHILDDADGLVAEDRPRFRLWHISLEDMQVAAADRAGVDPNDNVGRINDRGVLDGVPTTLTGAMVNKSLHAVSYL